MSDYFKWCLDKAADCEEAGDYAKAKRFVLRARLYTKDTMELHHLSHWFASLEQKEITQEPTHAD